MEKKAKKKKTLLDQASAYAFNQFELVGGKLFQLPLSLQTVIIIYTAQGIIDNGGFQYFFEADFPDQPPYSLFVDTYRRIGADDVADHLETAIKMFPFPEPHLSLALREEFLEAQDEETSEFLFLDSYICGNDTVWLFLEQYVSKHQNDFILEN